MKARVRLPLLGSVLFSVTFAATQNLPPTVRFTVDFPGANPAHYEIVVPENGPCSYSSNGQLQQDSEPADTTPLQFTLSEAVRAQIFDLARKAHYFAGKIDSGKKNLANTGAKTLAYQDTDRNTQASYNYSMNPPVQQLTQVFQNLSTTLEYGRRLQYFHKYEKLALDDDLKRMEELKRQNSLGDVNAISGVLNSIANDRSVINVSRARALRLLASNK